MKKKTFTLACCNAGGLLKAPGAKKLFKLQQRLSADITCWQEIYPGQRAKLMTRNRNSHHSLSRNFTITPLGARFSNLITSRWPLQHVEEITLPPSPTGKKPKVQLAWIWIHGQSITICNCHFPPDKTGFSHRLTWLKALLHKINQGSGQTPLIICGDFNTLLPSKQNFRWFWKAFHKIPSDSVGQDQSEPQQWRQAVTKLGLKCLPPKNIMTWRLPILPFVSTQLDWILYRGIEITTFSAGPYFSDHRPIWVSGYIPQPNTDNF